MPHPFQEQGTIIIPRHLWATFKRDLREAFNAALESDRLTLRQLHSALVAAGKGWRRFDYEDALDVLLNQSTCSLRLLTDLQVYPLLLKQTPSGRWIPKALLKRDLSWATRQTRQYSAGPHATITLSADATHQVKWHVDDDQLGTQDTLMAQTLFKLLRDMDWTRGSGGSFSGPTALNHWFGPVGEHALLARLQRIEPNRLIL